MTYRVAADLLEHMFPIDAGTDPGTLRRHTVRVGEVCGPRKPFVNLQGNGIPDVDAKAIVPNGNNTVAPERL